MDNFSLKRVSGLKAQIYVMYIITTPGEAGAVLQTPPSVSESVSESSFVEISSIHCISQTVRGRELNF